MLRNCRLLLRPGCGRSAHAHPCSLADPENDPGDLLDSLHILLDIVSKTASKYRAFFEVRPRAFFWSRETI